MERCRGVSDIDFEAFLKSPIDGMICLREESGKVRISKNTSVFTVKLNIDVVEDSRGLNRKSMKFELGSKKPSRSVFGVPWDLDLDAFWVPKQWKFVLKTM